MITFGHSLVFAPGAPVPVLLRNFYEPEQGYVWSRSKWCEIVFPFDAGSRSSVTQCDLLLDLDVFKAPPKFPGQTIKVYLNGSRIGQSDVVGQQMLLLPLPRTLLRGQDNSLVIDTPDACRPADWGVDDGRMLGIQLFSAQIQAA